MVRVSVLAAALALAVSACSDESRADGPSDAAAADAGSFQVSQPAQYAPQGAPAQYAQQTATPQGAPAAQPSPARGAAAPLPEGAFRMQRVTFPDPTGFGRSMTAGRILIPDGWTSSGGVVWSPFNICGGEIVSNWSARSPDGLSAIDQIPVRNWYGAQSPYGLGDPSQNPCQPQQGDYTSARQYLEAMVQQISPGARVVDYRSLTGDIKPLIDQIAQFPDISNDTMRFKMYMDAGELLVAYQENGHDMRAAVSAVMLITHSQTADPLNPGQLFLEEVKGFPNMLTIVRAPNGSLDLEMRKRVFSSIRYTDEWLTEYAKWQEENHRQVMKGIQQMGEQNREFAKQSMDIIMGRYRDSQIAADTRMRHFTEVLNGVKTYYDPEYGGPVQLDWNYNRTFRVDGDDSYILTNDSLFEPYKYGIDAHELKVIE